MIETKHLDYEFSLGQFKNMTEVKDYRDIDYKVHTLLHILNTPPGTYQDNPYLGIDTTGLLFAEGDEISEKAGDIKTALENV